MPRVEGEANNAPLNVFLVRLLSQKPPWLYETINKKEAERMLQEQNFRDGCFLVRPSQAGPGYVLMLCFKGKHHTYRIQMVSDAERGAFAEKNFFSGC